MALRSPLTLQPYDYIGDSTGRPLDKGQIYIGVAGQDPEFYQIPVFLDAEMTKPIDQPIRTNDGFVDFAGDLKEIYASGEVYSVKVLDKEGRKVLYKGDMTRKNLMSDALADLNQSIIDTQTAAQITLNAAVNSANTEVAQTVSLATAAIDTATTKSNKAATDADAAIKTLFENGGLPATPFKTKALMTASALVDGDYAQVTDDTVNNGLYVKTAGVWVKSGYDPVGLAVTSPRATYIDNIYFHSLEVERVGTDFYVQIKGYGGLPTSGMLYGKALYGIPNMQIPLQKLHDALDVTPSRDRTLTSPLRKLENCFILKNYESVAVNLATGEMLIGHRDTIAKTAAAPMVTLFSNNFGEPSLGVMRGLVYGKILEGEQKKPNDIGHLRIKTIGSSITGQPNKGMVNYDTVTKILTIPLDTLFILNNSVYIVNPAVEIDFSESDTTALQIFLNWSDKTFHVKRFDARLTAEEATDYWYLGSIRDRGLTTAHPVNPTTSNVQMDWCGTYAIDGYRFGVKTVEGAGSEVTQNRLDDTVKGIAHRGYSTEAPENTLPAYTLAKQKGFSYVECDVLFTSDGIPVLLHDATINRTSNSSGAISTLTLAQVKEFDFGLWKGAKYAGTKIPTLEEFLDLCRYISLHPYIELKSMTPQQAASVVQIVKDAKMQGKVTYISFTLASLAAIANEDPYARLGLVGSASNNLVDSALTLKNETNEVFADVSGTPAVVEPVAAYATSKGIDTEVWTVNNEATALQHIEGGASGITTDTLNIRDVLNTKYLG